MSFIEWENKKVFSESEIKSKKLFIKKNMSLLPLFGKERKFFEDYAKDLNVDPHEIFSIRNQLKSQEEIYKTSEAVTRSSEISNAFNRLVRNSQKSNFFKLNGKILDFIRRLRLPVLAIIKIIKNSDEYIRLPDSAREYLDKFKKAILKESHSIGKRAMEYENNVADFLRKNGIKFETEMELKERGLQLTPDFLFDEPVVINVDGYQHKINWIDAKNYQLTNTSFIISSLTKQSKKYYDAFGKGAFIFHYGIETTIGNKEAFKHKILMLDGSDIN